MQLPAITKHLNLAHGNIRPICGDRKAADEFELRQVKDSVHGREAREQIGILYNRVPYAPSLEKVQDLLLNCGDADSCERRNIATIHDHFIPRDYTHLLRIEFSGKKNEIAIKTTLVIDDV